MLDLSNARTPALPAFANAATWASMTLTAEGSAVRFILRGGADVTRAVAEAFAPLPIKPCRAEIQGGRAALWLGPDEWLLLDHLATDAGHVQPSIEAALGTTPHSLVDVSHRQTAITVTGPQAASALNMFVPLDLSEAAFPVGMVARTIFEKVEIVLWRRDNHSFHVEVWRSFAPYVAALLIEAQRELADV